MSRISLAVTGATGRMGRRIIALSAQSDDFELVAAIARADSLALAKDAGALAGIGNIDLPVTFDLKPTPTVLIDFTQATVMRHWLKTCRDRRIAMVIGTTGLRANDQDAIDQAAEEIPILQAPNMSLGVNLLLKIVAETAAALGDDYDKEIVEMHHRLKKEAPSGTAMALAQAILAATGKTQDALVMNRKGDDCAPKRGEIGLHSGRLGDDVGRHTVYFATSGERLEFNHTATNRDTFVHGALRAAKWLVNQKPGRYTMAVVLKGQSV
jgi:4-hydroxy-tetrahydrodipicolinate reductase